MAILPQRPLRGSRISSFYPIKSLPSLASLDSAFQLQEYISLLIRLDVHDVESIVTLPGKRAGKEKEVEEGEKNDFKDEGDDAEEKKNEVTVDEACWIYEQLRRLAQDLTHPLITMLQQECTRASCPEMKAGEWLYLCVAHGTDGNVEQCCAIDYILHTLDSATALLNTPRAFPSRLQIPQSSHRHFSSLARRLGRIFAHAYFHHREAFEQAEAESSLYARFLALTSKFDLVPSEFLVIPTHSGSGSDSDSDKEGEAPIPRVLSSNAESQPHAPLEQQRGQVMDPTNWDRRGSVVPIDTRAKSSSPPGLNNGVGSESPRKVGRNRTDTMVLHDANAVAEELAKASPKVPSLDSMDEPPMSPVDVEELPDTVKPAISLEETGSSLPESPTLNSPAPSGTRNLPADAEEEVEREQEPDVVSVVPVAVPATQEPTPASQPESMPAPVEADIAETALASTDVNVASDAVEVKEDVEKAAEEPRVANEERLKEEPAVEVTEETPKELTDDMSKGITEETPKEVMPETPVEVMEEVLEDLTEDTPVERAEEALEEVPVLEATPAEKPQEAEETQAVVSESSEPAPAKSAATEPILESAPAVAAGPSTTSVNVSVDVETVAEIPDEVEVASGLEVVEGLATPATEAEAATAVSEAVAAPAADEKKVEEQQEKEPVTEHVP